MGIQPSFQSKALTKPSEGQGLQQTRASDPRSLGIPPSWEIIAILDPHDKSGAGSRWERALAGGPGEGQVEG